VIRVGRVVGAFGIAGAVKVRSLTDFADRFAPGSELTLEGASRRVEWSRQQATGLVVKLAGVDDRATAQAQRGRYLEVPAESLRPLPAGRWYHHDLVGLAVRSESGRDVGTLTEVMEPPANDVWVAKRDGAEVLIPVIPDAIVRVDMDARTVTVADWVLDAEEDDTPPPQPSPARGEGGEA
jgi:16S rRNA processing protein RimM